MINCYFRYDFDNEEFITLMKNYEEMAELFGSGLFEDMFPYLHRVWPSYRFKMINQRLQYFLDWIWKHIEEHRDTLKPGKSPIQSFCTCIDTLNVKPG